MVLNNHPVEGDGVGPALFDHLAKENKDLYGARVLVPCTVLLEQGFVKTIYVCEKGGKRKGVPEVKKRVGKDCTMDIVRTMMTYGTRPGEVCAVFISVKQDIRYLTPDALGQFLSVSHTEKPRGLLQKFVKPKGVHDTVLSATWSPGLFMVESRYNVHSVLDTHVDLYKRHVTVEAPPDAVHTVQASPVLRNRLKEHCHTIVAHILTVDHLSVSRMVLHFKISDTNALYLLFATSIRISDSKVPVDLATSLRSVELADIADRALKIKKMFRMKKERKEDRERRRERESEIEKMRQAVKNSEREQQREAAQHKEELLLKQKKQQKKRKKPPVEKLLDNPPPRAPPPPPEPVPLHANAALQLKKTTTPVQPTVKTTKLQLVVKTNNNTPAPAFKYSYKKDLQECTVGRVRLPQVSIQEAKDEAREREEEISKVKKVNRMFLIQHSKELQIPLAASGSETVLLTHPELIVQAEYLLHKKASKTNIATPLSPQQLIRPCSAAQMQTQLPVASRVARPYTAADNTRHLKRTADVKTAMPDPPEAKKREKKCKSIALVGVKVSRIEESVEVADVQGCTKVQERQVVEEVEEVVVVKQEAPSREEVVTHPEITEMCNEVKKYFMELGYCLFSFFVSCSPKSPADFYLEPPAKFSDFLTTVLLCETILKHFRTTALTPDPLLRGSLLGASATGPLAPFPPATPPLPEGGILVHYTPTVLLQAKSLCNMVATEKWFTPPHGTLYLRIKDSVVG